MNTKNETHYLTRRLRVGIVGCGWVAGSQIERGFSRLQDRFTVAACCDADNARADAFAARHGIAAVNADFAALLAEDLDVISICTPPSLHHSMVLDALAARKHVICEKPFTSSLRLMDQVIEAEAASDRRVMPIFQYRFDDGIAKVRALIASGICGKAYLSSVETAWLRGADYYDVPWRGKFATELGGVLLTQAIHIHDLFLWLMGPAAQINGFKTTRVNPIEVEDCAVASVEMADGSLATMSATLGSVLPVTRIRLCFENLVIERQCHGTDAKNPGAEPWTVTARTPELQAQADDLMAAAHLGPRDFAGQFADFAEALATDRPFAVTLRDARRSLELISAIFHAAETGQTVQLPITADHVRYNGWGPADD